MLWGASQGSLVIRWSSTTCKHTQAKLRARLDKEENQTNGSKDNDGKDAQDVDLQMGQDDAPSGGGGCCSML